MISPAAFWLQEHSLTKSRSAPQLIRLSAATTAAAGALAAEAIAAVDRAALGWLERNLGFLAAARAADGEHLSLARLSRGVSPVATTALAALRLASGATAWAPRRGIVKPLGRVKLLLAGSKREECAAVAACEGLVGVAH